MYQKTGLAALISARFCSSFLPRRRKLATWLPGLLSELSFNLRRPLSGTDGRTNFDLASTRGGFDRHSLDYDSKNLFFGLCVSGDVIFPSPENRKTGLFWIELGLNIE